MLSGNAYAGQSSANKKMPYMVFTQIYKENHKDNKGKTHMVIGQYQFTGESTVTLKSIDINPINKNQTAVNEPTGHTWLYNPDYIDAYADSEVFEGDGRLNKRLIEKYGSDYKKWRNPAGKRYENQLVDYKYQDKSLKVNRANGVVNWNGITFEKCQPGEIWRPKTDVTTHTGNYVLTKGELVVTINKKQYNWSVDKEKFKLKRIKDTASGKIIASDNLSSVGFTSHGKGTEKGEVDPAKFYNNYAYHHTYDADYDNEVELGEPTIVERQFLPIRYDSHPHMSLTSYTWGYKGVAGAQGSKENKLNNFSGLYNGVGNPYLHAAYVVKSLLINQKPEWPALMSYLNSHIYDNGIGANQGKAKAALNNARFGPYCYATDEIVHGHKHLMLPVYNTAGLIEKIVTFELSIGTDGLRYPYFSYGYLQGE